MKSELVKKTVISRLNRVNGQINGIKKMVEEDKECNDILIQIKAASKSLNSLSNYLLENHLYICVNDRIEKGDTDYIDELVDLFKRFNK